MSTDPNFIQKLEAQAETFFEHMKEQIEEATHDAAPSSTEPVATAEQPAEGEQGNAVDPEATTSNASGTTEEAAKSPTIAADAVVSASSESGDAPNAPAVAEESVTAPVTAEVPNADAPTAPAGDAKPVAGEAGNDLPKDGSSSTSSQSSTPAESSSAGGEDPNAAVSAVAESHAESSPSATSAPSDAGESQTAASTPADAPQTLTFEQMVEARFLKLEAAVMQMPASMHAVMSDGSKEPEEFAKAVMAHVFAHI